MKKIIGLVMSIIMCALVLVGCEGNNNSETAETPSKLAETSKYEKVTIENFNRTTKYEKAPERVVVLSYDTAEIMAALGIADKIIYMAPAESTLNDVLPEYRETIKKIPVFKNLNYDTFGVPSFENILLENPDFIYGVSYSFNSRNAGDIKDYDNNNIKVYVTEGTYVKNPSLQSTYNDIMNIAKIFGVEEKGIALVENMKIEAKKIHEKVKNEAPLKVFVYDSGEDSANTSGKGTIETELIALAGGRKYFQ